MILQDMFERVLLNSGQFQISQDRIEINIDRFKTLVDQVVGIYNHYDPIDKHIFIEINTSRQYTFQIDTVTPDGPPDNIVEIIPVRISGVYPFYLRDYDRPKSNLDVKTEFPWEYRKPTITIPIQGEYDMHVIYWHKVIKDESVNPIQYRVDTIDDSYNEFMKLLTAKFMIGLALSRRAFTVNDLPITTDATTLADNGRELEKEAMEEIKTNKHKFYLAWRG